MSKAELSWITEWENDTTRLVALNGLPRGPRFPLTLSGHDRYYQVNDREIDSIIVHTSAGPNKHGVDAPLGIAQWIIRPKKTDANGKTIGGGRGWPGMPYTFCVPYVPEVVDGKFIVYRCWDDSWRTFHTGGRWNSHGVGVCFAGSFDSRHSPKWNLTAKDGPHPTQFEAGKSLVLDYLVPRYGIDLKKGLLGHFDCGKPTCPGDVLEQWIRETRGETTKVVRSEQQIDHERAIASRMTDLDEWRERQAALVKLGYDVGDAGVDGIWGLDTRAAVEAFQDAEHLVVDGIWGPRTEAAVRSELAKLG